MKLKDLANMGPWEWPPSAAELLLNTIRDRRAKEAARIQAVELASEYPGGSDELADAMLAVACDNRESAKLRSRAAISLGPVLEETDMVGFDDEDLGEPKLSEENFDRIREALRGLYEDDGAPKEVRRRVLEASVRSPQDWHEDAIREIYHSGDREWKLTAVFGMRYVGGFEDEILESLGTEDPDIHYEAVCAAGNWELDAAWDHIAGLIKEPVDDKPLLLAAIDAVASIRPREAGPLLVDLADDEDEEIADAATEAMAMADAALSSEDDEFDDDEDLDDEDDEDEDDFEDEDLDDEDEDDFDDDDEDDFDDEDENDFEDDDESDDVDEQDGPTDKDRTIH